MSRIARSALTAALALAALSQSSCALLSSIIQKPNVTLKDVKLTDVSFSGIAAEFIMGVDNPNPVGLDLASLGYQLNVDGHQFAAGQANQAVSVPANGSGQVTLPVAIKFADFIQSVAALFQKQTLPYSLATTLGFSSPIGTIDVPLSTQGTFPVPRLPDVSFAGVSMGGIDLTGATINLGIAFRNPNAFAVPLGTLDYRVSVAGAALLESSAQPGTAPASGTQSLPLAVRVDFVKAGLGVMNAIVARRATVSFDGGLDLGFYKLPVHLEQALGN